MAPMVGLLKPVLLAGVALSLTVSGAFAQDASVQDGGEEVILVDVIEGSETLSPDAALDVLGPACLDEVASLYTCDGALRFTPDFSTRVAKALAADDKLEMSAYDIGATLRDQHDLITEFDALYRATSALVLELVNMRSADRAVIDELRIARARLEQDYMITADALTLAQSELTLLAGQIRHVEALIGVRDGEIATLKAEIFSLSNTNDDELVQLRIQLQDSEALNVTLREQLTDANLRLAALGDDLAAAEAARDAALRSLTLEAGERLAAQDALAAALAQIDALTAEVASLTLDRDGLVQTISDQAVIIDELRKLVQSATTNADALTVELTLITDERDALLAQISDLEADRDEAEANWKVTFIELETTKLALAEAEAKLDALNAELDEAEGNLADLQSQLDSSSKENDKLRTDLEAAEDEVADASDASASYLEDLQLRDAAILILQQNLADAQTLVLDLRSDLDAALKDKAELEGEVEDLSDSVAERDETIEALKAELEAATQIVGEGSLSTARTDAELAEALAQIEALNAQIAALMAEAEAAKDAQAALSDRCATDGSGCAVIDDENAVDPMTIVIEGDDLEAQLLAARLELETLKGQQYVRVERVSEWLTAKMVGREDQAAIEFEPRRFSLLQDLLFETNSAELQPAGADELRRLALILRELDENPSVRQQVLFAGYAQPVDWVLQIAGHADARPISGGPFADNWELAAERALTVLRFLEAEGVASKRLQAASYGDKKSVAGRDDSDDVNRRVSFTVGIR